MRRENENTTVQPIYNYGYDYIHDLKLKLVLNIDFHDIYSHNFLLLGTFCMIFTILLLYAITLFMEPANKLNNVLDSKLTHDTATKQPDQERGNINLGYTFIYPGDEVMQANGVYTTARRRQFLIHDTNDQTGSSLVGFPTSGNRFAGVYVRDSNGVGLGTVYGQMYFNPRYDGTGIKMNININWLVAKAPGNDIHSNGLPLIPDSNNDYHISQHRAIC